MGRGSALYVRDTIMSAEVQNSEICEAAVWSEIKLRNHDKLIIGVVYRSPSSTVAQNDTFVSMIANIVNMKASHLMIMGDFNYPGIDWIMQTSTGAAQEDFFLEGFRDWFLWQHSNKPTHYRAQQTANILDLVFTNKEGMIENLQYEEPIGSSHHLTMNWICNCTLNEYKLKQSSIHMTRQIL